MLFRMLLLLISLLALLPVHEPMIVSASASIISPLVDERFTQSEEVRFAASMDGKSSRVVWSSDIDGAIGTGAIVTKRLSPGNHTVTANFGDVKKSIPVRVFKDLWELYQAAPSEAEVLRTQQDFVITWVDDKVSGEKWDSYNGAAFNQSSPDPAKMAVYARLNLLRHQNFAESLPFTGGVSAYDHIRIRTKRLMLTLGCGSNMAGGGQITLNRAFSVWDRRAGASDDDPSACKSFPQKRSLNHYLSSLYLFLHESRHNESGDPGHVIIGGRQMDPSLENGSGHAWAAIYLMWVYKYGVDDPPFIRNTAKTIARDLLTTRFAKKPTHSDPRVQALVDELWFPK